MCLHVCVCVTLLGHVFCSFRRLRKTIFSDSFVYDMARLEIFFWHSSFLVPGIIRISISYAVMTPWTTMHAHRSYQARWWVAIRSEGDEEICRALMCMELHRTLSAGFSGKSGMIRAS